MNATWTSQVISQHWFRLWLGAVRQQAITWANVDSDHCRHMAPLGHNELTLNMLNCPKNWKKNIHILNSIFGSTQVDEINSGMCNNTCCLFYIHSTMLVDALATLRARASADMALTPKSRNIPSPTSEELISTCKTYRPLELIVNNANWVDAPVPINLLQSFCRTIKVGQEVVHITEDWESVKLRWRREVEVSGKTWWRHQMETFSTFTDHLCGEFTGPLHKGQWHGAMIFSLMCAWINGWVNNREAGDLRRHRAHYDVIVM